MRSSNVFKEAITLLDISDVAQYLGLDVRKGYINCPFHREKTGSLKLYNNSFYCFGCGASGDVISLAAHIWGVSQYEALKKLNNIYSLNLSLDASEPVLRLKKGRHQESFYQEWYRSSLDLLAETCREYSRIPSFADELVRVEELHQNLLETPPDEAYLSYNMEVRIYSERKRKADKIREVISRRDWTTDEVLEVVGQSR